MREIPTLFRRDPDDMCRLLDDVHPACTWVLAGEGTATRKYDGTCVQLADDGTWLARREVKAGKPAPEDFVAVEHDETTDKTVGWEPIERSAFRNHLPVTDSSPTRPGTYELCGPKVNGNPEGYDQHVLVPHAETEQLTPPREYKALRGWLSDFAGEGIGPRVRCYL